MPGRKKTGRTASDTNKTCTPDQFIEVWQTSTSVAEVAERLNMPRDVASARASLYRSMGINLKSMKQKKPLDVDRLNALIAEINRKHGLPPPEPLSPTTPGRKKRPLQPDVSVQDIVSNVVQSIHKPRK